MQFELVIKCTNEAFQDNESYETARILRELAKRIEGHPYFSLGHSQPIYDANGNKVGDFDIVRGK